MKFLVFCLSFISTLALAQTIGVKDIPADGDTTIRVEKGVKNQNAYEITSGTDEIEGEAAPLLKEARANWKKACTEWKQETKEMNKDNRVLTLSCGTMKCSTSAMETTCVSEGKHKIKVKVN